MQGSLLVLLFLPQTLGGTPVAHPHVLAGVHACTHLQLSFLVTQFGSTGGAEQSGGQQDAAEGRWPSSGL